MTVYILGPHGMLGRYVETYLRSKSYEVIGFTRKKIDAAKVLEIPIRAILHHGLVKKGDVIVNCMGAIKPQIDALGTLNAIKVNSMFPHIMADVCEEMGVHLIHITTDCVFSGKDGNYTEKSPHDCIDVYGKSKSLGEPENCTVIRTSIIGEELENKRSLIEWVTSMDGSDVNGYLNHQWNGLTCHQTAKVIEQIISEDLYWDGVRHIYTPDSLNKHELVKAIVSAHNLDMEVYPVDGPSKCDRTLSTEVYDEETLVPFSLKFNIPSIPEQLVEQYKNPPEVSKYDSY